MVYKQKITETWDVDYDDQSWTLLVETEIDSNETYFTIIDEFEMEVEDNELFNAIIDYWERQTGKVSLDELEDYFENEDDWL
jgi:hypothetical protein